MVRGDIQSIEALIQQIVSVSLLVDSIDIALFPDTPSFIFGQTVCASHLCRLVSGGTEPSRARFFSWVSDSVFETSSVSSSLEMSSAKFEGVTLSTGRKLENVSVDDGFVRFPSLDSATGNKGLA